MAELNATHAIFLCFFCASSTLPSLNFKVNSFEQFRHNQKCSIAFLSRMGKPKNLPPSRRMSILEQLGFAHLEIMAALVASCRLLDVTYHTKSRLKS